MYRNLIKITTIFILSLSVVSCSKGKSEIPSYANSQNLPKNKIDQNIDSMTAGDWNPDAYHEILDNQINASVTFLPSDVNSLKKKLHENYSDQIVRCAGEIMASSCSPRHSQLNAMLKELDRIQPELKGHVPENKAAVLAKKQEHDRMLSFSVSSAYSAHNWTDSYDASYDAKKQAEAAAIRAKNPTCKAIIDKVSASRVASVLAERKKNYYRSIVNIYCSRSDWNVGDHNRILSKVLSAPNSAELKARLDNFKNTHKDNP